MGGCFFQKTAKRMVEERAGQHLTLGKPLGHEPLGQKKDLESCPCFPHFKLRGLEKSSAKMLEKCTKFRGVH